MTERREQLLKIVQTSDSPLNAAQIHEKTGSAQDLATVYRGLKYLEGNGFIRSFVFECRHRGIERYYLNGEQHHHYMHCEECHRFFPLPFCPFQGSWEQIEEELGFRVNEHFVTLRGTCRDCQ